MCTTCRFHGYSPEYDDKNRLTKVTTPTQTIEYSYDAQDHRIAKIVEGTTTTYLVDPNTPYARVIHESRDNGTEIDYSYGLRLLGDGEHTFLTDALGSTRALVDSSGALTDTYTYTPYGKLSSHEGTSENSFLFTGEQYDKETGNYYLRARYYSPKLSRFLSRNTYEGTLTDPLSQNAYLYARGNPAVYVDPNGRCFVAGAIDMIMVVDIMGSLRSSEIRFLTVRGVAMAGRASEIVLNSGHTVRALRAMRRSNRGLFERLENFLGEKVEIHHILEKRFYNNANKEVREILDRIADADELPGIVLTKSRHRIITKRWVEALKRERMNGFAGYKNITPEMLINAAQKVYYDDPIQMRVVVEGLFNAMMKL